MRALAGTRALHQHRHAGFDGALAQRGGVLTPARAVEIDRYQPAGLVRQKRVDPDRLTALQVPSHLGLGERHEPALRTHRALDTRLLAHA